MAAILDTRKWDAFLRGLDRASLEAFRKDARKSNAILRKRIREDWSGAVYQKRSGKSARSIRSSIVSAKRIMLGRPIESIVFSRRFTVRLHEKGYNLRRTRKGPVIKHIQGRHMFEQRTIEHTKRHRDLMEHAVNQAIRRATL